jgi:putative endonuclease
MVKYYYVYIMTNKHNTVLYIGVTNNLKKRVWEHKNGVHEGFTKKYNINKLVYYEFFEDIKLAIEREKLLKGCSRKDKLVLIEKENKVWKDLYDRL